MPVAWMLQDAEDWWGRLGWAHQKAAASLAAGYGQQGDLKKGAAGRCLARAAA